MPELPEVETVRAGLAKILRQKPVIRAVVLRRADIRFEIPPDLPKRLKGQTILRVRRRAKYLLIETPDVILLSHLGMTGSWRLTTNEEPGIHDHCIIELEDGRRLAFRDPRRFGLLDLVEPGHESQHIRLKHLGPEPLDPHAFSAEYLYATSRKRKIATKVFLMDQRIVVGVGNIYASEILFQARIRPHRAAARLSRRDSENIVSAVREVLEAAIHGGGSSIRDFRQAGGEAGDYQDSHQVYGREGLPCTGCGSLVRSAVLGGRSTFWCPTCQPR